MTLWQLVAAYWALRIAGLWGETAGLVTFAALVLTGLAWRLALHVVLSVRPGGGNREQERVVADVPVRPVRPFLAPAGAGGSR